MSYKVWSTIKGKKPVVMSFGEIKAALVKGELSMNDEYEEHFGQPGAISRGIRLRLGDVRVFRDARADAARERAEALAEAKRPIQEKIDARRRSLQTAAVKPPTEESAKVSGMQASWRACLISLLLSFVACPSLISGTRAWVVVVSLVGILVAVQLLRLEDEVTPSLFMTPVIFGLIAIWGFNVHLGPWFHGVMAIALCLAGSLMVDEFNAGFAQSFEDRLFIFIKYTYVLTLSAWLGWSGFADLPRFLTITEPAFGKGGEQAILLSLAALPLLVFVILAILGGAVAAVSWLKDGPSK